MRVSIADKVHNLRATVSDARTATERQQFWRVFKTGPAGQLAYYRALYGVYRERGTTSPLVGDLEEMIEELEALMTPEEIEQAARVERALTTPA